MTSSQNSDRTPSGPARPQISPVRHKPTSCHPYRTHPSPPSHAHTFGPAIIEYAPDPPDHHPTTQFRILSGASPSSWRRYVLKPSPNTPGALRTLHGCSVAAFLEPDPNLSPKQSNPQHPGEHRPLLQISSISFHHSPFRSPHYTSLVKPSPSLQQTSKTNTSQLRGIHSGV